jgi:SET domain-containing protein
MSIIRQSNINNAGYGVFAKCEYKKGDYICFYDAVEADINTTDDFIYSIKNPFDNKNYIGCKKIKNKDGIGQYINDSFSFELIDDYRDDNGFFRISNNKIKLAIEEYKNKSNENSNCGFSINKKQLFKIYATKDINENEELYLHYGIDYWLSKIQIETDEPFTKLFCLMVNKIINIKNKKIYIVNKQITHNEFFELLHIKSDGNIINKLNLNNLSNLNKIIKLIEFCK